ncbi:unnamed protein product [Kuraishia capsulata CBS 1993]|uniref:Uncharacterized protein n=1 Tax=Kuraishia capsulata CBS 1993 TaxID=1382522 RepID=W6MII3_9ASCO|nr:uncharacterized protein KUCA_T00000127001 [Kuraishia capsulata CBS 1993]CDK24167.1 unnamed protein product [Kuraishia capsulata CBS 1993]
MTNNATVSNVLGTIGTVLWCIQLSPQIYTNWKRKDTTGLPPIFMFLWAASGIPFSIYFTMKNSYIPMQVQPQMFTLLCTITWAQCLYYPPCSCPRKRVMIYVGSFLLISLGMEFGFIFWLKPVYRHGTHWPSLVFGILASIVLAAGLLPPYFELAKRKGRVVGINFFFLSMDCSGAVFSMCSVLVGTIDVMGMVLYAVIIVMEVGIFISHSIWYVRFRVLKKGEDIEGDPETGAIDKISSDITGNLVTANSNETKQSPVERKGFESL